MADARYEGVRNVRDCGGYPTPDGRVLKTGRLFRSGHHALASDDDLVRLRALGIATIVDLRRPPERETWPSRRWPGFAGRVVSHDGLDGVELPPHLSAMPESGRSAEAARAAMLEIYRGFPFDPMLIEMYRALFEALAEDDGAVLIHCAAGKDRTGFGVALVQHAAGVDGDAIMQHFLETNASDLFSEETTAAMRDNAARQGLTVTDGAIRTVMTVEPAFLEASFAVVRERSGSIDTYLREVIGVSDAKRDRLRARLVG